VTKARRHGFEKPVAGGVPKCVVDRLEVVEIEKKDRQIAIVTPALQPGVDRGGKANAI